MEQEKTGWINALKEAMEKKIFLSIAFKYPEFTKRTFKKGFVINVYDDSFDFDERFDGHVSYSYNFLVEVRPVNSQINKEEADNGSDR